MMFDSQNVRQPSRLRVCPIARLARRNLRCRPVLASFRFLYCNVIDTTLPGSVDIKRFLEW
jgi:hypothetical protein